MIQTKKSQKEIQVAGANECFCVCNCVTIYSRSRLWEGRIYFVVTCPKILYIHRSIRGCCILRLNIQILEDGQPDRLHPPPDNVRNVDKISSKINDDNNNNKLEQNPAASETNRRSDNNNSCDIQCTRRSNRPRTSTP